MYPTEIVGASLSRMAFQELSPVYALKRAHKRPIVLCWAKVSQSESFVWFVNSSFFYPNMQTHIKESDVKMPLATKCKVCQYAGRLLHLHSILQETSALYSYFEIQKWMRSYAVTCHADCIRLLAGRGKNMCREVLSLSTVIPIQYNTNTRMCCSLETEGKSILWCWPCPMVCYFWASYTTLAR